MILNGINKLSNIEIDLVSGGGNNNDPSKIRRIIDCYYLKDTGKVADGSWSSCPSTYKSALSKSVIDKSEDAMFNAVAIEIFV